MGEPSVAATGNTVREVKPGLWLLEFPTVDDVVPGRCAQLVPPLVDASKSGPLVVIASLPGNLRLVHPGMAPFWLNAFIDHGVRVAAISVITTAIAVKTVVKGFHLAMKLRERPIQASTFATVDEALAWAAPLVVPRQQ